jgi:hypothetical protein
MVLSQYRKFRDSIIMSPITNSVSTTMGPIGDVEDDSKLECFPIKVRMHSFFLKHKTVLTLKTDQNCHMLSLLPAYGDN